MSSAQPGRVGAALRWLARALLQPAFAIVVTTCSSGGGAAASAPTVQEVVEFTRLVFDRSMSEDEHLRRQTSPDGTRTFVVTRKANARTDRNRYEILLLDVRPERLVAGNVDKPRSLLVLDPVVDNNGGWPSLLEPRWVGNRTIVFRARLRDAVFQVFQLDTLSRKLTQLTFSATDVVSFAISDDLRTLVYTVQVDNPPLAEGRHGVVVGNQSFWSVKFGQADMRVQSRRFQPYVADSRRLRQPRRLGESFAEGGTISPVVNISPDGRWALLPRYEPGRQLAWGKDYPLVAEVTARIGPSVDLDPLGYFSRPRSYVPKRLMAWHLADGRPQDILDAPDDGTSQAPLRVVWQEGGKSVVIGGTHLPLRDAGTSRGSHLIEYWPESGRWEVIAELKGRLGKLEAQPGRSFVATDEKGARRFERRGGSWREVADVHAALPAPAGWVLRVRQGLDQPPDIVAEGPGGRVLQMTRLNPDVSGAWGTIRPYGWKDRHGRQWDGGLLVPDGFKPGARHPVVIQTYGFTPSRFYLDGANTSDAFTSGFAGRAFLREGILVLAFPVRPTTEAPRSDAAGIAVFMDGVLGAIDALVEEGIADRDRIGIMGWSTTGERVLNQLTFTDAPLRSATILDGDANTLFSLSITYGAADNIMARKARTNGGLPFGDTLAAWVRNDPSLHTDCVRAALRIETYGPWVLNNWDIYALLRRQYKAVEMVVIPDGMHALLTPGQRMLSLQGNVDWHRFWLKGEERAEPVLTGESDETLREQYRQWRQMVELKRIDDAKPPCARKASGG